MRWVLMVLGGLLVLVGGTWLLQGIGILPGSFMTGQTFWAVAGAATLVVGVVLFFLGLRRRGARR